MPDRFPGGLLVAGAAAFIVMAGGHGVGFVWMLFYSPLSVPQITFPAALGSGGIVASALWRLPRKLYRASLLIILLTVVIAFALSEAKLLTFVTSLPCLCLITWEFKTAGSGTTKSD